MTALSLSIKPSVLRETLLLVLFACLIAMLAQIRFYFPWDPLVPVTGQTFGVLLVSSVLGKQRGTYSVLMYLSLALPSFVMSGVIVLHLGYIVGFVAAAYTVGMLVESGWCSSWKKVLVSMVAGNAVIYLFALPWLALFLPFKQVITLGLVPFIPGDLVKLGIATLLVPTFRQFANRFSENQL